MSRYYQGNNQCLQSGCASEPVELPNQWYVRCVQGGGSIEKEGSVSSGQGVAGR